MSIPSARSCLCVGFLLVQGVFCKLIFGFVFLRSELCMEMLLCPQNVTHIELLALLTML
jgi:hypothetical protein